MCQSTHVNESCRTYAWIASRMWMRHAALKNESCHACDRVMSHIRMSHVAHVNGSCHRIRSKSWERRWKHRRPSCYRVMRMLRRWMRSCNACRMRHSRGIYLYMNKWKLEWTLSLPQTSRANLVQCCSTHQQKWGTAEVSIYICVTWFIHMCETGLSHVCDMTVIHLHLR